MVDKFNPAPDADHFGFITFHNKANVLFTFADSEYHDKDTLLQKIAREPLKLQLQTRTDLALIKQGTNCSPGEEGTGQINQMFGFPYRRQANSSQKVV